MARIRSVHPGLWTDEAFVSVSHAARLLFIGIWNEADDLGCFEWAPLKLKMRLLPADNVDTVQLLGELVSAKMLMNYAFAGRNLGAIRNFCIFQRPKKPKFVYPTTPEVRTFVASGERSSEPDDDEDGPSSPPVPHQSATKAQPRPNGTDPVPQKAEIPPQMEEGSRKREKKTSSLRSDGPLCVPSGRPDVRTELWQQGKPIVRELTGTTNAEAGRLLGLWLKSARDDCSMLLAVLHEARDARPLSVIPWIVKAIEHRSTQSKPLGQSDELRARWGLGTFLAPLKHDDMDELEAPRQLQ